jgi:hypothetical protein
LSYLFKSHPGIVPLAFSESRSRSCSYNVQAPPPGRAPLEICRGLLVLVGPSAPFHSRADSPHGIYGAGDPAGESANIGVRNRRSSIGANDHRKA